jgi:hypothetical protein
MHNYKQPRRRHDPFRSDHWCSWCVWSNFRSSGRIHRAFPESLRAHADRLRDTADTRIFVLGLLVCTAVAYGILRCGRRSRLFRAYRRLHHRNDAGFDNWTQKKEGSKSKNTRINCEFRGLSVISSSSLQSDWDGNIIPHRNASSPTL